MHVKDTIMETHAENTYTHPDTCIHTYMHTYKQIEQWTTPRKKQKIKEGSQKHSQTLENNSKNKKNQRSGQPGQDAPLVQLQAKTKKNKKIKDAALKHSKTIENNKKIKKTKIWTTPG